MSINIRNTDDDFFRYKMPRLLIKIEGRGNGIKTVMSNIGEVAKALGHPPIYPVKFLAYEVGANTVYDDKNDRYIIRGAHTAEKLQSILQSFISKFVLCDQCQNPETRLKTVINKKDQVVTKNCNACGFSGKIESANRLMAFVMKNHSQYSTEAVPSVERTQQKSELTAPEDDAPTENVNTRVNRLFKFVKKIINSGADVTKNDFAILRESESLEVRKEAPYPLAELLFDENILEQISTYRNVFLRICYNMKTAQKSLISAVVQIILELKMVAKTAHIMKKLYDLDILEEEIIMDWYKKTTKKGKWKELTDVVEPFIQWLKEAEEETGEEDDEDDGVVISAVGVAGIQTIPDMKEQEEKSSSEDDINIDDI